MKEGQKRREGNASRQEKKKKFSVVLSCGITFI